MAPSIRSFCNIMICLTSFSPKFHQFLTSVVPVFNECFTSFWRCFKVVCLHLSHHNYPSIMRISIRRACKDQAQNFQSLIFKTETEIIVFKVQVLRPRPWKWWMSRPRLILKSYHAILEPTLMLARLTYIIKGNNALILCNIVSLLRRFLNSQSKSAENSPKV